ncbi:FkbM family methyltransferase [Neoroseomonas rubea]|uniref:FkbM family methyltransferase n=1 Tax=Neoroseomonas rubea TaxID=2748666 RepID=UPI0018DEF30B|nr:FkbM family methyltransferase [Roseomonas rubea]
MSEDLTNQLRNHARKLDELRAAVLFQAMGPERIVEFLAFDTPIRMHLPQAATDAVQRLILLHGTFYETRQMTQVLPMIPRDAVIVDAGANIGNHTVFFAKICQAKEVHAFEPLRSVFAILQRNVALNALSNVRCHNLALGASEGRAELHSFPHVNIAASVFGAAADGAYPMASLDALALPKMDVLKIDVEGAQVPLLEGARHSIKRHRPLIWIELRANHGEYEPGDAALRSLGYAQTEQISPVDFIYRPG